MLFKVSTARPKAYDDGTRRVRFCFSDGGVDRMGDTIDPAGWDLREFGRNPVALWAHDNTAPPIGRCSNVGIEGGRLMGDVEFAPPETYAFADTIYRLTRGGFINAVSVGFLALDYERKGDGLAFHKQELLEVSVCPIPANANALAEARAKGIITSHELRRLRRDAENAEPTYTGNCGRPTDRECGLKDPSECAIHGPAAEDVAEARAAIIGEVHRLRQRAMRETERSLERRRWALEEALALSAAEVHQAVHELRCRDLRRDPRIIAAASTFRLRSW
jgi:HK97 family phage prohead protease